MNVTFMASARQGTGVDDPAFGSALGTAARFTTYAVLGLVLFAVHRIRPHTAIRAAIALFTLTACRRRSHRPARRRADRPGRHLTFPLARCLLAVTRGAASTDRP
ncbi:hypothetical protein [Streptomyces sp. NPDC057325]|uniref:hypothetical protein n=1 Tax=unclassified Streptomyces TaxID=2593676 RepID=UPI00363AE422